MRISLAWVGIAVAACFLTVGCEQKQTPDQLRHETAHATSVVKQDARAVVQGVHDGLRDGSKNTQEVDLNNASRAELLGLPGVTSERADKIIASRPFAATDGLVSRHILSEAEYDRIKDRVRVGPSGK
jgi:DNA uptake protein ComE-like DNA-binding protein